MLGFRSVIHLLTCKSAWGVSDSLNEHRPFTNKTFYVYICLLLLLSDCYWFPIGFGFDVAAEARLNIF